MPGLRLANRIFRHGLYHRLRVEAEFLGYALSHGYGPALWRRLVSPQVQNAEEVTHWSTDLPEVADGDALAAWFRDRGLRVEEGWHAFYLPPQPGLAEALGEMVGAYPENAGFKVLKSMGDVQQARYIRSRRHRVPGDRLRQG